ncbi:hypothetical protein FDZ84_24430 [Saccharopolyspora sp. ASAGF58]|nr:hypothetical protein FDZ84_24430 [Saccharopolyspora sp. ASAGF58]
MYFTVYTGSFNAGVFVPFLDHLTRHLDRTVQVIADGHPVHRRNTVRKWVDDHAAAIEMHFLPGYSPEINPDEIQGCRPQKDHDHRHSTENPRRVETSGPLLPPPAPQAA